jgi:hypothetical protein
MKYLLCLANHPKPGARGDLKVPRKKLIWMQLKQDALLQKIIR